MFLDYMVQVHCKIVHLIIKLINIYYRCGHCKKLAPEYEEAATALATSDPPIKLAKVDATEEKELGDRFGVTGYPTLKMFRKGKEYDYSGPREAGGNLNVHLCIILFVNQAHPKREVGREAGGNLNVPLCIIFYLL